jgi:hypothetical protein
MDGGVAGLKLPRVLIKQKGSAREEPHQLAGSSVKSRFLVLRHCLTDDCLERYGGSIKETQSRYDRTNGQRKLSVRLIVLCPSGNGSPKGSKS